MIIWLNKNEKNIQANKDMGFDKLPYFSLSMKEDDSEEWKQVASFWKKEKGYSCKLADGVKIDMSGYKPYTPNTKLAQKEYNELPVIEQD